MSTEDRPAIQSGDVVTLLLVNDDEVTGELIKVMSDEGQTDGLLKIQESGEPHPTFVYERHVITVRRA